MSLAFSLITETFVCHASDRRLTDVATGRHVGSQASKTVIVPPMQLLVSYTGLAQLDGIDTDGWLVRTMYDLRESADFFGDLGARAAAAARRVALAPRAKRHAFVVSGWFSDEMATDGIPSEAGYSPRPDGGPTAFCTVVTNFLSDRGAWLPEARSEFIHRTRLLPGSEPFHLFPIGASLLPSETTALRRALSSAFRSHVGKERAASAILIRLIDDVAKRDRAVGDGVFVAALARGFTPASEPTARDMRVMGVKWGLPEQGEATFVHIPDQGHQVVESPFVMDVKIAAKVTRLRVRGGHPSRADAGPVPEEAEATFSIITLAD